MIVTLSSIAQFPFSYLGETGILFFALVISFIYKKTDDWLGILVISYILGRGLYGTFSGELYMKQLSVAMIYALSKQAYMICGLWSLLIISHLYEVTAVNWTFACLTIYNAVAMHFGLGLFGNESQDACFVVCSLPLISLHNYAFKWPKLITLLCLISALSMGSATAAIMVSVFVFVAFLQSITSTVSYMFWAASVIGVIIGLGAVTEYGHQFWHDQGRLHIWQMAYRLWLEHNPLFGLGAGSFFVYGTATEQMIDASRGAPIWVHNDFLELAYSFGIIGFGLVMIFIVREILENLSDKLFLPWFMMFLSLALFQMPMSHPIFLCVLVYIFRSKGYLDHVRQIPIFK